MQKKSRRNHCVGCPPTSEPNRLCNGLRDWTQLHHRDHSCAPFSSIMMTHGPILRSPRLVTTFVHSSIVGLGCALVFWIRSRFQWSTSASETVGLGTRSIFSPQCNRSGIGNPGSHMPHYLRALECKVLKNQTIVPVVLRVGVAKFLCICNSWQRQVGRFGDNVLRASQLCVYLSNTIPQQVLDVTTYLSR